MKAEKAIKINSMNLVLPSISANEAAARTLVSVFVSQLDPTISELADIKCAVSEAVTNCIVHAYREEIRPIYITVSLYSDRCVKVEIRDRGCGIEDISLALTPMYTTDHSGERSGMGFSVMESFCSSLKVQSKPGRGTKVILTKKLEARGGTIK
jgi:stage II sporulation protein AB (anti-sigma F factor)